MPAPVIGRAVIKRAGALVIVIDRQHGQQEIAVLRRGRGQLARLGGRDGRTGGERGVEGVRKARQGGAQTASVGLRDEGQFPGKGRRGFRPAAERGAQAGLEGIEGQRVTESGILRETAFGIPEPEEHAGKPPHGGAVQPLGDPAGHLGRGVAHQGKGQPAERLQQPAFARGIALFSRYRVERTAERGRRAAESRDHRLIIQRFAFRRG